MRTPEQAGFEAGIMRRMPVHPYLHQSLMERQFMKGFKRGRDRRAWLDARGQQRVEHVVEKMALATGIGSCLWRSVFTTKDGQKPKRALFKPVKMPIWRG